MKSRMTLRARGVIWGCLGASGLAGLAAAVNLLSSASMAAKPNPPKPPTEWRNIARREIGLGRVGAIPTSLNKVEFVGNHEQLSKTLPSLKPQV